ncbi:MAG: Hsp20/alpha crystallin family protein [Planctomycetota bacterium]|jgi:HSP20 family protein|nr:Hsp20/alpha crystallin family protein [Planctomycetota bacterium]
MFWSSAKSLLPRYALGGELDILDRWLDNAFTQSSDATRPAFNVWADSDSALLVGELPGVKMEHIEVTASGNTIKIKGERQDEAGDNQSYLRRERIGGSFERDFELPFRIDAAKVEAKLGNGILEVNIPRAESDKPRKITVASN